MQDAMRVILSLAIILLTALPATAERPRPLGWALDAARGGDWAMAAQLAQRDGPVAEDVIEWMRLRDGLGTYAEVSSFLQRRPDWPGERYLRRQSVRVVLTRSDAEVLEFFSENPPQAPESVLRYATALRAAGRGSDAA